MAEVDGSSSFEPNVLLPLTGAGETLAAAPELILRGHFRARQDPGRPPRNVRIATLTAGDGGSFTASFEVPESASFGVFVVEDITGDRLDANDGRHFDLLIHDGDRSSLADALSQRARYLPGRLRPRRGGQGRPAPPGAYWRTGISTNPTEVLGSGTGLPSS